MRRWVAPCLCLLVFVPPAEAATQDELLGSFAALGSDPFFERYPGLLYITLNVTQRLQTSGQVPSAELAMHTELLAVLLELEQLDVSLNHSSFQTLRDGMDRLTSLHKSHETSTDAYVADNRPLLLRAEATMLGLYISRAEQLSASVNRTQERLDLLESAMEAAETIQDGPSFARLSTTRERVEERYQADTAEASARRDRVAYLLANPVPVLNPAFPRFYSDLLASVEDLPGAASRYRGHGETENVANVERLEAEGADYARRYGLVAAAVLATWAALWLIIAIAGLARIRKWAHDNRHAGLGDELGADV